MTTLDNWAIYVSSFFGIVLILFMIAFFLHSGFRRDLLASKSDNQVKLGFFSLKGTTLLVLLLLLILGVILPPVVNLYMKEAGRGRNLSENQEKGWKQPDLEKLIVSVVGTVRQGQAFVCNKHYGKTYELRGEAPRKSVKVTADEYIWRDDNKCKVEGVDMQISCIDAKQIFPNQIIRCRKIMDIYCDDEAENVPAEFCDSKRDGEVVIKVRHECDEGKKYLPDKECDDDPQWIGNKRKLEVSAKRILQQKSIQ